MNNYKKIPHEAAKEHCPNQRPLTTASNSELFKAEDQANLVINQWSHLETRTKNMIFLLQILCLLCY